MIGGGDDAVQLVVDVGNTETVVGVTGADDDRVRIHWRLSTRAPRTSDELHHLLRSLLREEGIEPAALRRAVTASVVPTVTEVLGGALARLVEGRVFVVAPGVELPITLDVEEPLTVGADRMVNTLAAREIYGRDTIAVDLGTATTFDLITSRGVFLGGVIAPGVSAGLEWLGRRTAKLPRVELKPPPSVVGRRTEACIQSGIFYSVIDGVDGVVRRIREEWDAPDPLVVATGGFASVIGPHCATVERVEPFLTLRGLALAGRWLDGAAAGSGPEATEAPRSRAGDVTA